MTETFGADDQRFGTRFTGSFQDLRTAFYMLQLSDMCGNLIKNRHLA
jgi:hypothetical protein